MKITKASMKMRNITIRFKIYIWVGIVLNSLAVILILHNNAVLSDQGMQTGSIGDMLYKMSLPVFNILLLVILSSPISLAFKFMQTVVDSPSFNDEI